VTINGKMNQQKSRSVFSILKTKKNTLGAMQKITSDDDPQ